MSSIDDFFILLANPYHIKKIENKMKKENELNDHLFTCLTNKFPLLYIKDDDRDNIMEKIESFLIDISIKNTINDLIDNLIIEIENELL